MGSNYDSFHWMDTYGDPGFEYHIAIAQVIALLTAKLVEEPIISFSAADYAIGLKAYLKSVEDMAEGSKISKKLKKNLFKSLRASIGNSYTHLAWTAGAGSSMSSSLRACGRATPVRRSRGSWRRWSLGMSRRWRGGWILLSRGSMGLLGCLRIRYCNCGE